MASLIPLTFGCLPSRSDGLGQQVDARAPRHVVEDHGQVDGLGDREEVRLERALRRLDVVRRHDERAVRPQCFRPPAHGHDGARVDGARAGHDGHAAAARVDARLEHAVALGGVQRRSILARRAERHDAVRAGGALVTQPVDAADSRLWMNSRVADCATHGVWCRYGSARVWCG